MSTEKRPPANLAASLPLMTDQVYEAIHRDILCCALPPGAAISEASLAARYGYGKSPVRLALSRLRQEGLVHASPRRSFVVSSITLRDVHDLYEVRVVLEPAVARLAAGKVDVRALKKADAICRKGYVPGDAVSTMRFLDANRAFHLGIAQASGNPRFVRMLAPVFDETTRVMHIGLAFRDRSTEMQHEHETLLGALERGEGAAAARIAEEQVMASREMVLAALYRSTGLLDQPIAENSTQLYTR
jgi:DNA-binding GntR family transcriptional regulator